MSKTVVISDQVAALLEAHRKDSGLASLDAAADAVLAASLSDDGGDHSAGLSDAELRLLLDEADASGPAVEWSAPEVRAEVLRRYAGRAR